MKKWIFVVSASLAFLCSHDALAARPVVTLEGLQQGPTPFISFVRLRISSSSELSSVHFEVLPKRGSRTRHIAATYAASYLTSAGYYKPGEDRVLVPVFGLYQNFANVVKISTTLADGSTQLSRANITTPAFDNTTYTNPTVVQPRLRNTTLSFDFVLLQAYVGDDTPVIIDSDGEVRWVGSLGRGGQQAILYNNAVYGVSGHGLVRQEFDGRTKILSDYTSLGVTGIHHNFDYGRDGILVEVDLNNQPESVILEVDGNGQFIRSWDFNQIVSNAMIAGGDNPSSFVIPAVDWFHNNAATYRPSDDSLVVSSRENFVITVDYDTQAIKWILGDPTKQWFLFPSLRAFALTLGPDTLPPIGQHAVSIVSDRLLLFDDGTGSTVHTPAGETRTYSAPRKYEISGNTAREVYHYLADPPNYSPFCSSVYEDAPNNYLIDYTLSHNFTSTDIVALDSSGAIAFYYSYPILDGGCGTAFYSRPIHLENLQFH